MRLSAEDRRKRIHRHIHAVMNTAVYAPVVVVFVCSGMYKQFGIGRGEPEPAPQN